MKRPTPPNGFVRYESTPPTLSCPMCGSPHPRRNLDRFSADEVQEFFEEKLTNYSDEEKFKVLNEKYNGTKLKNHWSRHSTGYCQNCGCKHWHDFGGENDDDWRYYYDPSSADKSKIPWDETRDPSLQSYLKRKKIGRKIKQRKILKQQSLSQF